MIRIKTIPEVELIRESALLVSNTLAELAIMLKAGITTEMLNKRAEEFILDNKAVPSFKNYRGYPFATCISVNDAVVHGFPNNNTIKEGDLVSIDVGVYKNGFHADSAYTYGIGEVKPEVVKLLQVTKESLYLGLNQAQNGKRVGDVAYAVQSYTESFGYGVVRELVGHGVGKSLHESPEVPNYGRRGDGAKLKEGMVIAIEPMINLGKRQISVDKDGWTIRTQDRKPSAHFEHTIGVSKDEPLILTTFSYIEEVIKSSTILLNI